MKGTPHLSLAQLIRRRTLNLEVRGSIPHQVEFAGGRSDEGALVCGSYGYPTIPGIAKLYVISPGGTQLVTWPPAYIWRRTCGTRKRPEGSSDRRAVGMGSGENNRSLMLSFPHQRHMRPFPNSQIPPQNMRFKVQIASMS